jgi:hypothetical protein
MLARFENLPTFVRDKRQGFFGNFDCRVGKPHQTSGKQRWGAFLLDQRRLRALPDFDLMASTG